MENIAAHRSHPPRHNVQVSEPRLASGGQEDLVSVLLQVGDVSNFVALVQLGNSTIAATEEMHEREAAVGRSSSTQAQAGCTQPPLILQVFHVATLDNYYCTSKDTWQVPRHVHSRVRLIPRLLHAKCAFPERATHLQLCFRSASRTSAPSSPPSYSSSRFHSSAPPPPPSPSASPTIALSPPPSASFASAQGWNP